MINPQQIRIGNTLQYTNDERLKEDRIGKLFQVTNEDIVYFVRNAVDYVVYAPLTEEWLVKAGFVISNQTESETLYLKGGVQISKIKDTASFHLLHHAGCTTIEYIHQVENLFFSIMGFELENK